MMPQWCVWVTEETDDYEIHFNVEQQSFALDTKYGKEELDGKAAAEWHAGQLRTALTELARGAATAV